MQRTSFELPLGLHERLRRASYWKRKSQKSIVVEALRESLDRMERNREEPFPPIPDDE